MTINVFDGIRREDVDGNEFWSARELYRLLGYTEYGKFLPAVERAKEACKNSGQKVSNHFARASEMVPLWSGAERSVEDLRLSRYACYLVAQNGDPRKEEIALAQTYFAIQTRKREMDEKLLEDGKRVLLRDEMKEHNKNLAKVAKESGVVNYADFQDAGYSGLYGGLRQKDIHARKKLKPTEKILDHMGSEELAANLFRATQAEAKLKRENIFGQQKASKAHYDVGKKVRQTIVEIGGTVPEKLPAFENVKESRKRLKAEEKRLAKENPEEGNE